MFLFAEFPDIKVGGVPEEVKEKIKAVQRRQHELQDVMSEVGQDKVTSHVKSYVVESTLCMNMAFNMLTDIANLVKNQNKLLTEKDAKIKKLKKQANIFRKIKNNTKRNLRRRTTTMVTVHIVTYKERPAQKCPQLYGTY